MPVPTVSDLCCSPYPWILPHCFSGFIHSKVNNVITFPQRTAPFFPSPIQLCSNTQQLTAVLLIRRGAWLFALFDFLRPLTFPSQSTLFTFLSALLLDDMIFSRLPLPYRLSSVSNYSSVSSMSSAGCLMDTAVLSFLNVSTLSFPPL